MQFDYNRKAIKFIQMHRIEAATYLGIVLLFCFAQYSEWTEQINIDYINAIIVNDANRFVLPLLYLIGRPLYEMFGEIIFFLLPLTLLLIGTFFLFRLFSEFRINKLILLIGLIFCYSQVPFNFWFSRDNLLYFLACIFAYFFFKELYLKSNTNNKVVLLCLCILIFFTKSFSLPFILLFLLVFVKQNRNRLIFPMLYPISDWYGSMLKIGTSGKPWHFIGFLANPIFAISTFCFLFAKQKRTTWLILIIITGIMFGSMLAQPLSEQQAYRYTFSLVPLHLFFIASSLPQPKIVII